jgi:hypothetical protein
LNGFEGFGEFCDAKVKIFLVGATKTSSGVVYIYSDEVQNPENAIQTSQHRNPACT